jgi:hypothetical protein
MVLESPFVLECDCLVLVAALGGFGTLSGLCVLRIALSLVLLSFIWCFCCYCCKGLLLGFFVFIPLL